MASRKNSPLTRAQLRILKTPRSEVRRVTVAEKLANPGKFSLKGEYLVPKTIKKVTSKTAAVTVSRFKDFAAGVSHSTATALRKTGLLGYKSAASEAQATAQRTTKATEISRRARKSKAARNARRVKAAKHEGFAAGARQRAQVIAYINEKYAQHERYLRTNQEKLDEDEYRKTVHLMYEYFGDDERVQRMHESFTIAIAA